MVTPTAVAAVRQADGDDVSRTERPYASTKDGALSLRFHAGAIQSRMLLGQPDELVLEYTRLMMGFQLFVSRPARIAMIGLGGGSIAKYCLRYLQVEHFVAVEINPAVVAMRRQFHIPPDSHRFRVVEGNGGDFVQSDSHQFDVLMVDAFTQEGMPRQVCNAGFYDDCFARLSNEGVLALNFHASEDNFGLYVARLRESFHEKVVCIETDPLTNRVVFAGKSRTFPPPGSVLRARAALLTRSQPIDFRAIARRILARASDAS